MDEVIITASSLEFKKEKDADGGDVFVVTRRHFGKAGTFNTDGSTGGVYSSWETVLEKIKDLNLPSRLLNGVKKQLDSIGSATINMTEMDRPVVVEHMQDGKY
jgi:hypothetical protein